MRESSMSNHSISNSLIEIDPATKRGHERFVAMARFSTDRGVMTWHEWAEWQRTRDPIAEYPEEAEKVRARIEKERTSVQRGPGMAKRPRPASTTSITKAQLAESSAIEEKASKGPAKVDKGATNIARPNFQQGSEGGCYS